MPDAAPPVNRFRRSFVPAVTTTPRFLTSSFDPFDTSTVVPLRSSSCLSPDLVLAKPFPSVLTTVAFDPSRLKVVWNLPLQADSEGPPLIS